MIPTDMNNVRFKVLIVLSLIFLKHSTNAQQLNWAKRIGNLGFDDSYALALDNNGNVYTAGSFSGTVDFNPGSPTNNLTVTEGINIDAFISKLDSAGNYVWAINFGGRGSDEVRAIKIDDSNNIYVTGTFKDTADFDPGPNVYTLIPTGNESVFVAKYDSAGAFIWAQNIAASFHVYASGMDIDQTGSVYITGNYLDTVDFDPGPNVYQLTTNTMYDGYILKLNSNGEFCWAKSIGQLTFDMGYDIKTDDFGAVYTVGTFRLTVDFDPGPGIYNLTSNGSDDVFILKLDTAGNFIWAKSFGGTSFDYGRGLSIDPFGNVITTGSFSSIVDFNPGLGVFNISQISLGGEDIFVSKLDSAGNFLWAKQFGGVGLGFGAYVSTNNIGDVFTTGRFDGVTDFNPGPGVLNFTQVGLSGADMYIVKLSPSGNFFWAKQIAGPLYDYAYAIEPDAYGNIYYTGFFEGTVDFDPNTPVYNMISAGSHDIFVSKLGGTITAVQEQNFEDKLMVYPVPASDHIIIHTSLSPSKIEMFDINGRLFLTVNKEELQFINNDLYLSTDKISNGIYFLKISDELDFSTQKIVVQH